LTDCLIIGGGPAGLTAAIYAARFRLSVTLIDAGASRAALIPLTRNHAGFPGGVSGQELLQRMRAQADEFAVERLEAYVTSLTRDADGFVAIAGEDVVRARAVILTTGVRNRRPRIAPKLHDQALAQGALRYCPVCDGYEVTDKAVAVIGDGARAVREAQFLRGFTADVSVISTGEGEDFTAEETQELIDLGIARLAGPAVDMVLTDDGLMLNCGGERRVFASVYPALGSDIHSDLARALAADLTEEGCIVVDAHQRTSVAGLYAAGDVVMGLDQISHAMGEAGVAATTLRNDLAKVSPLLRQPKV
jgi:thioredoxin reductase (NADPH)